MKKNGLKILLLCLAITLIFGGCALKNGDGLLSLPKLPGEYIMLQKKLDEILATGASYAVASTGPNRQAVQLVDIDSDGDDEAIAFFSTPQNSFMVCVYKRTEEGFAEIGRAEGFGTAIRAVNYPVCDANGKLGLAISWSLDETSDYGMTVFNVGDNALTSILDVQYNNLIIEDINLDGVEEICLAMRINDNYEMRTYSYSLGEYKIRSSVPLCHEVTSVARMTAGYGINHTRAIYVDSVSINGGYVTDVISMNAAGAVNETIDHASGSGRVTARAATVFCADINGDGILDVPTSGIIGKPSKAPDSKNLLIWKNFSQGAQTGEQFTTYHSVVEEWYLRWPDKWGTSVTAFKRVAAGISKTTFVLNENARKDDSDPVLLNIYVYSGDVKIDTAAAGDAKIIGQWGNVIYAYSVSADSNPKFAITDEELLEAFELIEKEWPAGGFSQ